MFGWLRVPVIHGACNVGLFTLSRHMQSLFCVTLSQTLKFAPSQSAPLTVAFITCYQCIALTAYKNWPPQHCQMVPTDVNWYA